MNSTFNTSPASSSWSRRFEQDLLAARLRLLGEQVAPRSKGPSRIRALIEDSLLADGSWAGSAPLDSTLTKVSQPERVSLRLGLASRGDLSALEDIERAPAPVTFAGVSVAVPTKVGPSPWMVGLLVFFGVIAGEWLAWTMFQVR